MPNVEGLTPSILWTTLYGFIAICILVTVVLTAYEKIKALKERKLQQEEARRPGLADQISRKVLEQLEPRFADIEAKLSQDKQRIDNHERLLAGVQETSDEVREGLHAYGKTMLVLLNHGNLGDSKEVKEATDELMAFLAKRI